MISTNFKQKYAKVTEWVFGISCMRRYEAIALRFIVVVLGVTYIVDTINK